MCFRRKREGDGNTFLGGFEVMKLWSEMRTTADLTKMRTKGISNFKRVCNRGILDFKNWSVKGRVFSRKFMNFTPNRRKRRICCKGGNVRMPAFSD